MDAKMNNGVETFPLDDAAIQMIAELKASTQQAQVAMNAILSYFCKQHQLLGRIELAENGRELIVHPVGEKERTV